MRISVPYVDRKMIKWAGYLAGIRRRMHKGFWPGSGKEKEN
jgi:hypothetical protein